MSTNKHGLSRDIPRAVKTVVRRRCGFGCVICGNAIVHGADIQDRDGGALLLATLFGRFPFLLKLYADGGYQGPEFQHAVGKILRQVNIEIAKRSDQGKVFVVLPKRWIVERTSYAGIWVTTD